jgi:hypothetical protein
MIEDLPDGRRAFNNGDHLHRAPAARTQEGIDLVHLPDEAGPGAPDLTGCPIVRARDWIRRFGFREEPVLLAVKIPEVFEQLQERREAVSIAMDLRENPGGAEGNGG